MMMILDVCGEAAAGPSVVVLQALAKTLYQLINLALRVGSRPHRLPNSSGCRMFIFPVIAITGAIIMLLLKRTL